MLHALVTGTSTITNQTVSVTTHVVIVDASMRRNANLQIVARTTQPVISATIRNARNVQTTVATSARPENVGLYEQRQITPPILTAHASQTLLELTSMTVSAAILAVRSARKTRKRMISQSVQVAFLGIGTSHRTRR